MTKSRYRYGFKEPKQGPKLRFKCLDCGALRLATKIEANRAAGVRCLACGGPVEPSKGAMKLFGGTRKPTPSGKLVHPTRRRKKKQKKHKKDEQYQEHLAHEAAKRSVSLDTNCEGGKNVEH